MSAFCFAAVFGCCFFANLFFAFSLGLVLVWPKSSPFFQKRGLWLRWFAVVAVGRLCLSAFELRQRWRGFSRLLFLKSAICAVCFRIKDLVGAGLALQCVLANGRCLVSSCGHFHSPASCGVLGGERRDGYSFSALPGLDGKLRVVFGPFFWDFSTPPTPCGSYMFSIFLCS